MKKQIENLGDIKLLVDQFYTKVREDELLSPIFHEIIGNKWPEHLEKMYRFWQTILLEKYTYSGNPFLAHAKLGVTQLHFNRWITLFYEVLDSLFEGVVCEKAKLQGDKMSKIFSAKIEFIRKSQ
jgi:hemoglobin